MNPEKENALNESLAMTKLTIDLLNQKKKDSLRLWIVIYWLHCRYSWVFGI